MRGPFPGVVSISYGVFTTCNPLGRVGTTVNRFQSPTEFLLLATWMGNLSHQERTFQSPTEFLLLATRFYAPSTVPPLRFNLLRSFYYLQLDRSQTGKA